MPHLLVTNDFPPKVGGIQTYLWELWRRLPPGEVTVLTTAFPGAAAFDRHAPMRIERVASPVLVPSTGLVRRIDRLAAETGASLVLVDPVLWPPLGLAGPRLDRPYGLVLHGAEVTVPGRLPLASRALARAVRSAAVIVSAGEYAAGEARRVAGPAMPQVLVVPPGVDTERFRPLDAAARAAARARLGVAPDAPLVVGVSRLVPRKGFDVLIDAAAELAPRHPDLVVAIGGTGRDRARLEDRVAARRAPVRLLGRVVDAELPALIGCADAFAMLCRNRWGGLEQEGFGIVFVEAAACGVAQIAGRSGGAAEAVVDGRTGVVVDEPADARAVALAVEDLLADRGRLASMGAAARERAVSELSWDVLAARLAGGLRVAA